MNPTSETEALPASPDTLDSLIYATVILFILSVITEKLTQLVRMYPTQFRTIGIVVCVLFFIPLGHAAIDKYSGVKDVITTGEIILLYCLDILLLVVIVANTELMKRNERLAGLTGHLQALKNINKDSSGDSTTKEKEVTLLSFILGFIVAYAFNANLFYLFENPPRLGWQGVTIFKENTFYALNPEYIGFDLYPAIGFLLTAFFLAFGSKFFHDLLDTLLQAKNLKRKLNDKETFQADDIQKFDEYISLTDHDLAALAINQNEGVLKAKFTNISFMTDTVSHANGRSLPVVGIYLNDSMTDGLPKFLPAKLPSGRVCTVPTEIIPGTGPGVITAGMDGALANNDSSPGYKGSACCMVKNNAGTFVLTNCHVLTQGNLFSPLNNTGNAEVAYDDQVIGTWTYGSIDASGDFALVNLEDPEQFRSDAQVERFSGLREIRKEDHLKLQVSIRGYRSKTRSDGYVIDVVKKQIALAYNYGNILTFDEVILVGNTPDRVNSAPVSDFSDSGGVVYDNQNQIIGIITGKNQKFSVILPLKNFITNNNLHIL